jgi:hypothetical protein
VRNMMMMSPRMQAPKMRNSWASRAVPCPPWKDPTGGEGRGLNRQGTGGKIAWSKN